MTSAPPLWVLSGPTASGKSALALELAQKLGAEIVGADSQQVYQHFDIGTAKPSAQALAAISHHLISFLSPQVQYSAAAFQAHADEAIRAIQGRHKPVLVVGGTGLYLRVLLRGLVAGPPRDEELRRSLQEEGDRAGWTRLWEQLREVDPESAAHIAQGDPIRIVRALEIHQLAGISASSVRRAHGFLEPRHRHRWLTLVPERERLHRSIRDRAEAMWKSGLLEEAKKLCAQGYRDAPPMKSVGYLEALAVLDGKLTAGEALEAIALRTRHYAKRQLTWFRKEPAAMPWDGPLDAGAVFQRLCILGRR